jgi:hypothetical protein
MVTEIIIGLVIISLFLLIVIVSGVLAGIIVLAVMKKDVKIKYEVIEENKKTSSANEAL